MRTEQQDRLERIAVQLDAIGETHAAFAEKYGSVLAAADAAAHRRAAEIIRHQIECEN